MGEANANSMHRESLLYEDDLSEVLRRDSYMQRCGQIRTLARTSDC